MSGKRLPTKKKKRLKTRNMVLFCVGAFLAAFIIYTLAVYTIKGWQWDALFPYVLGVGGVVDVMTAIIAIKKNKGE